MDKIENIIWHVKYGSIINKNKKLAITGITYLKRMQITDIINSNLIQFYYLKINSKVELIIEVEICSYKKGISGIWHFKHYKDDKWNIIYTNNKISLTTYKITFAECCILFTSCNILLDNC